MSGQKERVQEWYDGFCFGSKTDIYNPWSITNFLDSGEFGTYWADTSSNRLVSDLIRRGTPQLKMQMEDLLEGGTLETELDEQVVFDQLGQLPGAVWGLLLASGYLKPVGKSFNMDTGCWKYTLQITNHETVLMFRRMIASWFPEDLTSYNDFIKVFLAGDLEYMNQFMNEVAAEVFGSLDTGKKPSEKSRPERFYHGFVLELIVELRTRYQIRSNRQSGWGRYDVMIEPKGSEDPGIIIEFKVYDSKKEKCLEETVSNALDQIRRMKYDTELVARGIETERIRHYGFGFRGQEVLIGEE